MIITLGNKVRIDATFKNLTGTAADPDGLTLRVKRPRRPRIENVYVYGQDAEVVKDGTGKYHTSFKPSATGRWRYYWLGSGDAGGATEGEFRVTLNYE